MVLALFIYHCYSQYLAGYSLLLLFFTFFLARYFLLSTCYAHFSCRSNIHSHCCSHFLSWHFICSSLFFQFAYRTQPLNCLFPLFRRELWIVSVHSFEHFLGGGEYWKVDSVHNEQNTFTTRTGDCRSVTSVRRWRSEAALSALPVASSLREDAWE